MPASQDSSGDRMPPPPLHAKRAPSSAARTNRKYTSKACEPCRRRRAKCDGKKPHCTRCAERALACAYAVEDDGRRPASKAYVQLLRQRIDVLERTLQAHSIDVHSSAGLFAAASSSQGQLDALHAEATGILSRDAALSFDGDGVARYFGLASGRVELISGSSSSSGGDDSSSTRLPGPNRFYQNIVDERLVSKELEEELIALYFRWEQPWLQVIDEKLFRESRAAAPGGRYCSPLLLNCIMAVGSRFCSRPEIRSDPGDAASAGDVFLEKANILLHYDLKWPSITTLQSLCILGSVNVGAGSDAAGWLHAGMAHRLALDMGLNLDPTRLGSSELLTPEDMELRRRIYWSLYCVDKLSSVYTGRVCTVLDHQALVALPSVQEPVEFDAYESRRCFLGKVLSAFVSLSRIMEKILCALYNPRASDPQRQSASFTSNAALELKSWHYDLSKELSLESGRVPQNEPAVYILHMVYHTAFILLMKQTVLIKHDEDSLKKSHQSANEICSIAHRYQKAFGSFRRSPITATHCILSAVLTLLHARDNKWYGVMNPSNNRNIELGMKVLEELSVPWNPAKRFHQSLQKLYQPSLYELAVTPNSTTDMSLGIANDPANQSSDCPPATLLASMEHLRGGWRRSGTESSAAPATSSTTSLLSPINQFDEWNFNEIARSQSLLLGRSFAGDLCNSLYMETASMFTSSKLQ